MKKRILVAVAVVIVGMQFVPVDRDQPRDRFDRPRGAQLHRDHSRAAVVGSAMMSCQ